MSLSGVVRWKVYSAHHCCGCLGILKPRFVCHHIRCLKPLPGHTSHRIHGFLWSYSGHRLLSVSYSNLNIFSKLISYLGGKAVQEEKTSKPVDVLSAEENKEAQEDVSSHSINKLPMVKLDSLLQKLPPFSPYGMSKPLSADSTETKLDDITVQKRLQLHEEIVGSGEKFLQQYDKDLDKILKKTTAPPVVKRRRIKSTSFAKGKKSKEDSEHPTSIKAINYPTLFSQNKLVPTVTPHFAETQKLLQSLGIPCHDLELYPEVQTMPKDVILRCIKELSDLGIQVIFNVSLLQRMDVDIKRRAKNPESPKNMKPLTSLKMVRIYLELCQLLDRPNLDIIHLLKQLAEKGQYDDMPSVHRKVKKLRAVGATPKDIWSNLEILQGTDLFNQKIRLYENRPYTINGPFPVHLFLAQTLSEFKEQLGLGEDVDEVARLLGVTVMELQACWRHTKLDLKELRYKVQMCLNAGISQRDIFDSLSILNGFPVEKCHAVTSNFRDSGMPASIYVLRHMEDAIELNGNRNNHNQAVSRDVDNKDKKRRINKIISNSSDISKHISQGDDGIDWTGETTSVNPIKNNSPLKKKSQNGVKKNITSSKKQRRAIFHLIQHHLQLDQDVVTAMFEGHVSVDSTSVLDVTRNLDCLLSLNLTREQIAKCPLVLAHPTQQLVRVIRDVEKLVVSQLLSSSSSSSSSSSLSSSHSTCTLLSPLSSSTPPSSSLSSSSPSSSPLNIPSLSLSLPKAGYTDDRQWTKDLAVKHLIFDNPTMYLNTLQYLLEKENCFSLASVDSERLSGFLNV